MTRTREEQEKWLVQTMKDAPGIATYDNLARALLDAGVTVPEPPAPRYYAKFHTRWGVYDRHGNAGWIVSFDGNHPDAQAAAQAEADRLNAAEGGAR